MAVYEGMGVRRGGGVMTTRVGVIWKTRSASSPEKRTRASSWLLSPPAVRSSDQLICNAMLRKTPLRTIYDVMHGYLDETSRMMHAGQGTAEAFGRRCIPKARAPASLNRVTSFEMTLM